MEIQEYEAARNKLEKADELLKKEKGCLEMAKIFSGTDKEICKGFEHILDCTKQVWSYSFNRDSLISRFRAMLNEALRCDAVEYRKQFNQL